MATVTAPNGLSELDRDRYNTQDAKEHTTSKLQTVPAVWYLWLSASWSLVTRCCVHCVYIVSVFLTHFVVKLFHCDVLHSEIQLCVFSSLDAIVVAVISAAFILLLLMSISRLLWIFIFSLKFSTVCALFLCHFRSLLLSLSRYFLNFFFDILQIFFLLSDC